MILTMDRSGSMTATDVAPDRMTAAREAASTFVEGAARTASRSASSRSRTRRTSICRRRPTAQQAIDALGQLQAENGTALGDAITRSLDIGLASLDGTRRR